MSDPECTCGAYGLLECMCDHNPLGYGKAKVADTECQAVRDRGEVLEVGLVDCWGPGQNSGFRVEWCTREESGMISFTKRCDGQITCDSSKSPTFIKKILARLIDVCNFSSSNITG